MRRAAFLETSLDGQPGVSLPYPDHVTHASASQGQPVPTALAQANGPHIASLPGGGLRAGTAPDTKGPNNHFGQEPHSGG